MTISSNIGHHDAHGSAVDILTAIFSGFRHPVIVKDDQSRFLHVNGSACELLGHTATEIIGRTDHDFLPKEQADQIVAIDRHILTTGEDRLFEEVINSPEGKPRTLVTHKHCVMLPFLGVAKRIVIAVITDVTDLREAERVLRASEEHYRSLIELHPQVSWVADANGDVTEVGPTWTQISGLPADHAYGSRWAESIHIGDLGQVREQWQSSVATGRSFDVESRIRTVDGSYRWFRNRAAPRRDGHEQVLRWYGLLEDIHERKTAEEALRESESRFRLIADSVPVIIWLTDETGATTYLNRNWFETTGQTEEQALEDGWLNAIHPEDRASVLAAFQEAIRTRTPSRLEYRLRRKDGSWAWVIDIGEPRLTADGALCGFAGSVLDISERRATELALQESEAFIRSIFESSPDCVRLLDLKGNPLMMNKAGRDMFGLSSDADLNSKSWKELVDPSVHPNVSSAFSRVRSGETARFEAIVHVHGQDRCMDVIAAPVLDPSGAPVRMLTMWRDVTDAKAARDAAEEARLRAERAASQLSSVLESTMDCVIVIDHGWRITYMNSNARTLLSLGDAALGQSLWSLYSTEEHGAFVAQYRKAFANHEPVTFEEYLASQGLWIEVHASPTEDGLSIFFRDTSKRRRAEQERFQAQTQILHMSRHDMLTGLANRLLFRERLEHELLERAADTSLAVLMLDLDGFKAVNDTYGHPVGDVLLRQVADRLRTCVRENDTIARIGGDEFVVVQPSLRRPEDSQALAKRIIASFEEPFDLDGLSVSVGTSVGIALSPSAGRSVDQLVRASDIALYRAKAEGRGIYRQYVPGMDAHLQARQELKVELKNALARRELEVFFQPLILLASQRVSTCEALVRWRHPEKGLISPAEFIPVAEESGLIIPIGEWVLNEACLQAAQWPDEIAVAVNLSPLQFKSGRLAETISQAIQHSGIAASRLQLEITESVMLDENETNLKTLQEIRRLGAKISMDDFGTGYSSLGYLRSFPFDKIKVDRGFINDLPEGRESLAIIRAVAGIGRSLGITTTVEGVETQAQLDAVNAEGFDEAQGYLFSSPMPASDLLVFLAERRRAFANSGGSSEIGSS
jgi:diguanylate cyclase (GGDEF)-like protein/PAS domain S-box-containing protein